MREYGTTVRSDNWHTPRYIFEALGVVFDLDVAAPRTGPRHVPCHRWLWKDGLNEKWSGLIWMNPPFGQQSAKRLWLQKFFYHGNGVALMPDRTSAPWWREFAHMASAVLFVSPKIKFERDDGSIGESPGTGTALLAAGKEARYALIRGKSLGTVFSAIGGTHA